MYFSMGRRIDIGGHDTFCNLARLDSGFSERLLRIRTRFIVNA
jgi:hypothetical protein